MKVLSIKQPWAWAIIKLGKNIENRNWKTNFRGRFYVHASLKNDKNAPPDILEAFYKAMDENDPCTSIGSIIGSVELVDVVRKHYSPWFEGPFGFVLRYPEEKVFFPMRGKLGFWEL